MTQSTFSTHIGTLIQSTFDILVILAGGLIKSNLSRIPPNPLITGVLIPEDRKK